MVDPQLPESECVTVPTRRPVPVAASATTAHHADGVVVITVCGEIDLVSAPLLGSEVAAAFSQPLSRLVVDLSSVTFFGAAGANVLATATCQARATGIDVLVVGAPPRIVRALCITGLEALVSSGSLEDALIPTATEG